MLMTQYCYAKWIIQQNSTGRSNPDPRQFDSFVINNGAITNRHLIVRNLLSTSDPGSKQRTDQNDYPFFIHSSSFHDKKMNENEQIIRHRP